MGIDGQWQQGSPPFQPDIGRVASGSPRSITGLAIVAAGGVMVLSAFLEWGHISDVLTVDGQNVGANVSLPGVGSLGVKIPVYNDAFQNSIVESNAAEALQPGITHPGGWAIGVGVLAAAGGVSYLVSRLRTVAALGVAILAAVGFVIFVSKLVSVRGMFGNPADWNNGNYSAGIGLLIACAVSLILVGLGITALVLERLTMTALSTGRAPSGPPVWTAPLTANLGQQPQSPQLDQTVGSYAQPRVPGAPATLGARAGAFAIDSLLVGVSLGVYLTVVEMVGYSLNRTPATIAFFVLALLLAWIALAAYFALSEGRSGRTVGKRAVGIVVLGPTGARPTLTEAMKRNAVHLLWPLWPIYVVVIVVIAIAMVANPEANPWRLGLHDRMAGPTRVANGPEARGLTRGKPSLLPWAAAAATVIVIMSVAAALDLGLHSDESSNSTSSASNQEDGSFAAPTQTDQDPNVDTAAPTTTSPSLDTSSQYPDMDAQGFTGSHASCDNADSPAATGRTAQSQVVICARSDGTYYYRGVRLSDGAQSEFDGAQPLNDSYEVVSDGSADPVYYTVSPDILKITSNGDVLASEQMLEYRGRAN